MNITHLTQLMVSHYLVKIEMPKMHANRSSPFNTAIKKTPTYFCT